MLSAQPTARNSAWAQTGFIPQKRARPRRTQRWHEPPCRAWPQPVASLPAALRRPRPHRRPPPRGAGPAPPPAGAQPGPVGGAGPSPRGRPGLLSPRGAMRRQALPRSLRPGGASALADGLSSAPGRRRPRRHTEGPAAGGSVSEALRERRRGARSGERGRSCEGWERRPALTVRPLQGILGPLEVHRHDGGGLGSPHRAAAVAARSVLRQQPARPEREGPAAARGDVAGSGSASRGGGALCVEGRSVRD